MNNRKLWIEVGILTGILAVMMLVETVADNNKGGYYAWWGMLYPRFCYMENESGGEDAPVRIELWLHE